MILIILPGFGFTMRVTAWLCEWTSVFACSITRLFENHIPLILHLFFNFTHSLGGGGLFFLDGLDASLPKGVMSQSLCMDGSPLYINVGQTNREFNFLNQKKEEKQQCPWIKSNGYKNQF